MAHQERVLVKFIKPVHATVERGCFGYGRGEGEVAMLPLSEAKALASAGVVRILEQKEG